MILYSRREPAAILNDVAFMTWFIQFLIFYGPVGIKLQSVSEKLDPSIRACVSLVFYGGATPEPKHFNDQKHEILPFDSFKKPKGFLEHVI